MGKRANGEGCIIQRKDGRWQASLQVDGRRKAVYGKTRQEVAQKLAELQRQAQAHGTLPDPGRRTLDDLLDAWLQVKAPNVKPRTLADYAKTCDWYLRPPLGKLRLPRLSPDRIARLYAKWQRAGKAKTALKCHRALSQALALAVRWDWLASNPCDRVDTPRYQPQRKELWTRDELRAFLAAARDHWLYPFWAFLAYSGCRLGEALALEWSNVDLATGRIVIAKSAQRINGMRVVSKPKTRAGERTITLPREGIEALRHQAQQRLEMGASWQAGDLVFSSRKGAPLSASTVGWALTQACRTLGLPHLSPHGLRHLHASLLLAEGLPLPEAARRLGHANPSITASVYSHAVRDDTAAAQAIGRAIGERK